MGNKKGFTLVELLAVIAILAILVIIALPNVLDMFNTAKVGTFVTEAQTIYKTAQQDYLLNGALATRFSNVAQAAVSGSPGKPECKKLNMTGNTELRYVIDIDTNGLITYYAVYDLSYAYTYTGTTGLKIEQIKKDSNSVADGYTYIKSKDETNYNTVVSAVNSRCTQPS